MLLSLCAVVMYFNSSRSGNLTYEPLLRDVRLLRQLDSEFNENVLLARNLILKNYDPLVKIENQIQAVSSRIALQMRSLSDIELSPFSIRVGMYSDYNSQIDEAQKIFDQYLIQKTQRLKRLEVFKSSNSVLKNSLFYMPAVYQEMLSKKSHAHHHDDPILHEADHIYHKVLLFIGTNNLAMGAELAEEIAALHAEVANGKIVKNGLILRLLDHCAIIVKNNSSIIEQMRFFVLREDKGLLETVYKDLTELYDTYQGQQNSFKSALFATTIALILYVALLFRLLFIAMRDLSVNNELLKKADKAKSEFLANMSHEIRTPLNGVIGLTQLLSEGEQLPEQAESINAIVKSSESLLFLLNDILDFSKIEAGQIVFETLTINLKDTIKHVVDLMAPLASKKGIVLRYRYAAEVPQWVSGDPGRIGQIVTNLVGNALKFTSEGTIAIEVKSPTSWDNPDVFEISVTDTGIGIPENRIATLFQQFSQVDASTTRKYGGTGLGLAISKKLSQAMKGDIFVESSVGQGSTFTLKLPLEAVKVPVINMHKLSMAIPACENLMGKVVMVVDDHPVNRLFASKLLRKIGAGRVIEAVNGQEAVDLSHSQKVDVILMDCQMPEMDGFEATQKIRARERSGGNFRTPIIAMTAHAMAGDKERCLEAGMDDYLSKPINPGRLADALGTLLAVGSVTKELSSYPVDPSITETEEMPVQLDYLNLFTDGNLEDEIILVNAFLDSGHETLLKLQDHVKTSHVNLEEWRRAAHKLKGASSQLGAERLSRLCLQAEEIQDGTEIGRLLLLDSIVEEFRRIEAFFRGRYLEKAQSS
jgi:signal transduction histidine kinase/DNA-binding response OmpR family regulator